MKSMKRAVRRHHWQRKLVRALRSYRCYGFSQLWRMSETEQRDWARRNFNNMQRCSCIMCGHRRKWYGPTVRERRQNEAARYEIERELNQRTLTA